jgi:rhomboid protease GluP
MKQFWAQLREFTPHSFIVQTFICINVLIFLIMTAARFTHPLAPTPRSAGSLSADLQFYVDWGANYGPLTNNGQPWRLLTCTFLHFGFLHLAANLFALYAVGNLVARMYGNVRFLLLYIGAGLAGSLMSVTFKPTTVSGGASGAIFGICSGLLAYLVSQSESVPPLVRNKLALSISIFSAYSLVAGFLQPGIDNAAHIGGLVGGAILGLLLSLTLPAPAKRNGGVRHD